jgi:hypothetical protein
VSTATTQSGAIAGDSWSRLRTYRNPLRMAFSSGVWGSAWYVFSSLVVGTVLFSLVLTATVTSFSVVVVWAGIPLLIGTAYFIRGCVGFERLRARVVVPEGLPALAPTPSAEGVFGNLKALWTDRTTQRGLVHFVLLYVPLFVLNTAVFALWMSFLGMISLPIWYRYIPETFDDGSKAHGVVLAGHFPHGPHGPGGWGFWIGSDQAAIVAAVAGLLLLLAWNYVLVAVTRLNISSVRVLISDYRDPLADAKRVLHAPGPLSTSAG